MSHRKFLLTRTGAVFAAGLIAGCGGSGGDRIASPLPPQNNPTPAPNPGSTGTAVTIFAAPQPGKYASVGVSISASGGNLDTYPSATARFESVSSADSDQAHVRYSGDGYYEIQMPGQAWDRLVHYKGIANPTAENNYFQPSGIPSNTGFLAISNASKWAGYAYSEMGIWGSSASSRMGAIAFGVPTPAGGVPTSGSATYDGKVQGTSDIMQADNLYGGFAPMTVDGTVKLTFDFGSGTLAGEMSLYGPDGMNPFDLGTFSFEETVFAVGSTSYSGKFQTSAAGDNFFLGRFTGPNAQETIGAWALPFIFTKGGETTPADGQLHQAFGAWVAKNQ